jgi:uncharacterized membrane protein
LLGFPLTFLSFFFIAKFIYSGKDEVLSQISNFSGLPFFIGLFFLVLFFLFRSFAWKELLKNKGHVLSTAESSFVLANAEIKRYIPGGILSFIARIEGFGVRSVPSKTIIKLMLYESGLLILTAGLVSIPASLYFFPNFSLPVLVFILILIIASLTALLKKNFNLLQIEKPFFIIIFAWIFYGLGNLLISASFVYLDASKTLQLSSLFVMSWLAGYLVFFVPMGLGIRESAVVFGLSQVIPVPLAASIAIATRIIFVFAEILFLGLSLVFYKVINIRHHIERHVLILGFSIASYIAYFTYYSFQKHANFFTGRFDLGNMDQTVWNTLNGRIFQLTNPDGTSIISRLAIHSDYILILLAPFYLIWEDPRMLLLIQSVVLGIGAYYVYQISNHLLKHNTLSLIFGISFLLNPFVQKQNLFDFHAIVLATTFLLAAFYYALKKRMKYFWVFLVLAVMTKENVYAIASIFGIFLFLNTKNKRWLLLTVFSGILFYVTLSKLIPAARGEEHFALGYFQEYGDSPIEIVTNILLNPVNTIGNLLNAENLYYMYKLLLPLGFLSILSPLYLVFAVPDLLINLLSENENFRSLTFHYAAAIIPFIYISAIYTVKRLLRLKINFLNTRSMSYFVLIFSLAATYAYGVLPGARNPSVEVFTNATFGREKIKEFLTLIPSDLSVASTNNLGAHLSHRTKIYTIPHGVKDADVIVFLLNDSYARPSLSEQREYARTIQNDPSYIELYRIGDFIAFAKRSVAGRIGR